MAACHRQGLPSVCLQCFSETPPTPTPVPRWHGQRHSAHCGLIPCPGLATNSCTHAHGLVQVGRQLQVLPILVVPSSPHGWGSGAPPPLAAPQRHVRDRADLGPSYAAAHWHSVQAAVADRLKHCRGCLPARFWGPLVGLPFLARGWQPCGVPPACARAPAAH